MTSVSKVLALMVDGQPRTKEQMMQELGMTKTQVTSALRKARTTSRMIVVWSSPIYSITESGKAEVLKPEKDLREAERLRSMRRRQQEKEDRASIKKANAEIRGVSPVKKTTKSKAPKVENKAIDWKAKTGAIPNSVFAMGSM